MHYSALPHQITAAARDADAFTAWLASGDELIDAATLLGGHKWRTVAQRVVAHAQNRAVIERALPELRRLGRLLMLDHVDDLGSDEAALFMDIHPDDPRADNARICAEALQRGIAALELARPIALMEAV
jgi:hypothetical protein